MNIPVNLINKYLKHKLSTEEIVESLEKTEIEVEEVLHTKNLDKKIVTAKILQIDKHPNADRLNIVKLQLEDSKTARVVCGAPNVDLHQIVAYAKPGTTLPDGSKIAKAVIRGTGSAGMLCSPKELGRSDNHDGVVVLDPDLPLGISLCDIEDSQDIIDIKTPANRFDMLSFIGVAREISANSNNNSLIEPRNKNIEFVEKELAKVEDKKNCRRFISVRLKINKNAKSPQWLVDNLIAAGMRPISAVVDITNFVMLETGQPSHAYDTSKLNNNLGVRFAKKGEKLTTLDGGNIVLEKSDLIIVDKSKPVGLAGVIGGKDVETDDRTSEILIEVANFDKTTVRRSAIRHGIRTEASSRFEKGLPLPLQEYAIKRLIYLFEKICGGKIVGEINDQLYAWPWIQHVGLRIRKAERLLGMKLEEKQVVKGLAKRGFEVEHFSIVKEAKKHLGKPYKWGANFKQDGTDAFDCSYLIDYIYSLIGIYIGHTALAQYEHGESVEIDSLRPGDVVFYEGKIENSVTDHYYMKDGNGQHRKKKLDKEKKVGHNGIYIGKGKVIMAAKYEYVKDKWIEMDSPSVVEVPLNNFIKNPGYLGARRYVDNFNHTLAVTAPWWREDIRIEQDLYEECAKIAGYENLPATLPSLPPSLSNRHETMMNIRRLRELLVDRGLFEVMSYSFVSHKHLQSDSLDREKHLKIVNPLSVEQEYLRTTLMSSHMQIVKNNSNHTREAYGFFEISRIYDKVSSGLEKTEKWTLAITIVGNEGYKKSKSLIDAIGYRYHWRLKFEQLDSNRFEKNMSANILSENDTVGSYGQIDRGLLKKYYKYSGDVSFCELNLDDLDISRKDFKVYDVEKYQLISRDITLELEDNIWWQQIVDSLDMDDILKDIQFIDEFKNDDLIKQNKKRISFRLMLDMGAQPNSQEIVKAVDSISKKLLNSKILKKPIIV